jgi:hypothetical protein
MPMLPVNINGDTVRWLQFLQFDTVEEAQSYVDHSSASLHIIQLKDSRIGVVYPWDIGWIKELGIEEISAR